jgi:CubicO group peptidase (beta-lactamase class C family)
VSRLDWRHAAEAAAEAAAAWCPPGAPEPGGVVLLFDRDGPREAFASGRASLVHPVDFDASTPTRLASLTKSLFAAFALRVGLDRRAPLSTWLAALPPAIGAVTLERALSMTGGLPDLLQTATLLGLPYSASVELDALDAMCDRLATPDSDPGIEFSYSNSGYRLAERAARAAGASFGDWLQGEADAALGAGFGYPAGWDRPIAGLADGHWRESADAPWRIGRYGMGLSASGAATGSARDVAAWFGALLRGGGPAGDILPELARPVTLRDGRSCGYGLGLATIGIGPHRWIGHGGHLPGHRSHVLADVASGTGVVVLSNREDTDAHAIALQVMATLHGASAALSPPATDRLPDGLFVTASGDAWLEHRAGQVVYLGATETVYAGDAPEVAVSRSPYLPLRLRADGDGISGETGLRARRFARVAAGVRLDPALDGAWLAVEGGALLEIDVARGVARLGLAGARLEVVPTPLGPGLALLPVGAQPWTQRAMIRRVDDAHLTLATNRSRNVTYRRLRPDAGRARSELS